MTDKSAGRRYEPAEPTARTGAALVGAASFPPAANDNAPPLLARALAALGAAGLSAAAVGLLYFFFG